MFIAKKYYATHEELIKHQYNHILIKLKHIELLNRKISYQFRFNISSDRFILK